jgi:hypothetical protein
MSFSKKQKTIFLISVVALYIVTLFVYSVIVVPRPYYIQTTDVENDYYYNARLVYNNLPLQNVTHPGIPLKLAFGKLMYVTGDAVDSTQKFLNIGYGIHAFLNFVALVVFIFFVASRFPFGVGFFAMAFILAMPSFLTYQDYIGAEAVSVALGLSLITLIWILLTEKRTSEFWITIFLAFFIGFAVSVKYTYLLIAAPVLLIYTIQAFFSERRSEKISLLVLAGIVMFASFAFFIAPVFNRLPTIINGTILRQNLPSNSIFYFFNTFYSNILYLAVQRPLLTMVVFLTSVAFIVATALKIAVRRFFTLHNLFLVILFLEFIYTFVASGQLAVDMAKGEELGVSLRNSALPFLSLPFILLYVYEVFKERSLFVRKTVLQLLLVIAGVGIIFESFFMHIEYRNNFIMTKKVNASVIEHEVMSFLPLDSRIAVWSTGGGDLFREAAWHFWGNYWLGMNMFDSELNSHFEPITFFQYRTAGPLFNRWERGLDLQLEPKYPPPLFLAKHPFLHRLYLKWRDAFPPVYIATQKIITGEEIVKPDIILFPDSEREISQVDDVAFTEFLNEMLGKDFHTEYCKFVGQDWTMYTERTFNGAECVVTHNERAQMY